MSDNTASAKAKDGEIVVEKNANNEYDSYLVPDEDTQYTAVVVSESGQAVTSK